MTHILPKKHSDILKLVKSKKIPSDISPKEREKIDILHNLKNDEYITGIIDEYYSNVITDNLRITIKGENALANTKLKRLINNPWFIKIIGGLILLAILLFFFQPWQHSIQEKKLQQKKALQSQKQHTLDK